MTDSDIAVSPSPALASAPSGPVLAICKGDPQADRPVLELAASLADASGVGLEALGSAEKPGDLATLAKAAGVTAEAALARLRDDLVASVRAGCEAVLPGRQITVAARLGKPFLEIIREVHARKIAFVLKAADALPARRGPFFASTDQHLLRKCPCPVWLLRADGARPPRRLLAAVDVDALTAEQPETQAGLNRAIVEVAARIAAFSGAELHLLHVWEAPGEGAMRLWSHEEADVGRYLAGVEAEHRDALEGFRPEAEAILAGAGLGAERCLVRLKRGAAREVIPHEIEALEADTLVMGTVGRIGVAGLIIGNTAEDVLNSVECSVVTVKPPDYISPVV